MPPETIQPIVKRLPSCDSCKFRRIRCFPVPPPDSCSCCKAKGIVCSTTPVVRRKPKHRTGKRIEIAKQKFGTVKYPSTFALQEVASTSEPANRRTPSSSPTPLIEDIIEGPIYDFASTTSTIPHTYTSSRLTQLSSSGNPPPLPVNESAVRDMQSSKDLDIPLYRNCFRSPLPHISAESGLINTEFSGALLADLLYLYTRIPRSRFLPCLSVISTFETAGRRLETISPVTQTLVLAIAAMTARLSSNPILFGSGRVPPALSSTFFNPHRLSIEFSPEWGLRREAACEKLREMAIEKAWCARVINDNSPQSLAVCFILQFLEDQLGSAGDRRMWASAFVQQLRVMFERRAAIGSNSSIDGPAGPAITNNLRFSSYSAMPAPTWETWIPSSVQITSMTQLHLANTFAPASWSLDISMNQDQLGLAYVREPHIRDMGLRWCIQIMREALISACRSEICVYTIHDEIMLVGPPPPSPAEVISGAFDDLPWWDFGSFLLFVRPFTYRATQIALESPQWQTRRLNGQPFSLSCLEEHLSSLSSLHTLMKRAQVQYSGLFSPEGLTARYQALCHSAPDMANDERNLRFWTMNRNILYTSRVFLVSMKSALGALTIPIYLDLLARIRDEEAQRQFGSGTHQTTSQRRGVDDVQQITQLLINLKRVLLPYAREVLHDIQSGANLGWITHLGNEPLKLWCSIILDSTPIEDGGDGITRAQRVASLETAFRIFKILTWSWPRVFDDPLVLHTQHVVEEGIRNGVYSSSSMVDHVPRSSFGIDPLTSENTGIWPSYLGLEEAWKVMEPIAAVSLKTVYTADAIPAMPWPKVHSIPSTLDLPDIQQMMQGLNLHDEPAGGSAPPSLPPSSAPTSKVAFTDLYNFNEAAFRSSSRGVQAQTQTQTRPQAGAPLQMPDLSEFDMTFFGGEAVPTTSLPKPSFAGIPSAHSDPGIHMRGYSQTSPTGWLEWTVGHFWS